MKNSKLFVFGLMLLAIVVVSCHKGRGKLVNSWKVTAVEAKAGISDSLKTQILENGTLTFTKDGHVTGFLRREIVEGSFVLTEGGKHLVIKDETGTPYSCESTITEDQLVLDDDQVKITLDKM